MKNQVDQSFSVHLNLNFLGIPVATLRGDQKISFNVYIRVQDSLILYLQKGDSFEGKRLSRLKEKNLKFAYIKKEDAVHYYDYLHLNHSRAYDDSSRMPIERRAEIIQGDQQAKADSLMRDPVNQLAYRDARTACGLFVNFVMKNPKYAPMLLNFDNPHSDLAQHGFNVATMALALAKNAGYQDSKFMAQLALGAMVHDIGHYSENFTYPTDLENLSPEARKEFLEHPKRGAIIGQDKAHFDQPVINIIMQHEECIDGSGYPQKLIEKQMDPTIVFVATANALDRLLSFQKVPIEKAAKKFVVDELGKYPLENVTFLRDFIKKMS